MSSLSRVSILRSLGEVVRSSNRNPSFVATTSLRKNFSSSSSSDSENDKPTRLENVDTMKCLNRVTLLGRATAPAVISSLGNVNFATFTLATNELRRNRANELIRRADFHRIQVFAPRMVEKAKTVVQRGSRILIEGKINYNVRKGEHGNVHFTNITADNIVFFTGVRPDNQPDADEVDIMDEVGDAYPPPPDQKQH